MNIIWRKKKENDNPQVEHETLHFQQIKASAQSMYQEKCTKSTNGEHTG